MHTTWSLLGFLVAVTPLVVTPGASFTLVTARAMAGDRRGSRSVIVGTGLGICTHAALAGAGLAALVMRSAQLYAWLRLAGALYLVGLGLFLLRRGRRAAAAPPAPSPARRSTGAEVAGAYVANVLNVKAAAVYLTLAPQFLSASDVGVPAMLALGLVHVAVMAGWLGLWASGLQTLGRRIDRRRWAARADRIGGVVLVALGVRAAVARP